MRIYRELGPEALDDAFQSLMFLGPPGVGKSALQYIAAVDVARLLSDRLGRDVRVLKVSIRTGPEEARRYAEEVASGRAVPYLHLYLPQTKIWHLEGTPSPMDNYVVVAGRRVPVNIWRLDAYMLPFLDYGQHLPAFMVLDEFNMARREVLEALFQLARSAELGRVKLSPLTIVTLVGNTPESNVYAARRLAQPLVDRAQNYIVERPTVDGWLAYMEEVYGGRYAREVAAFLVRNPEHLYREEEDGLQTPRGWTHLAVRVHALKLLVNEGVISNEKFFEHVERLAYSTLLDDTAAELVGFMRGLRAVKVREFIDEPSRLEMLDPNVAAYVLVKAAAVLRDEYARGRREWALGKLAELTRVGVKVLGPEAVSIVMSSLPLNLRIALSGRVGRDVVRMASEAARLERELRETVSG